MTPKPIAKTPSSLTLLRTVLAPFSVHMNGRFVHRLAHLVRDRNRFAEHEAAIGFGFEQFIKPLEVIVRQQFS